MKKKSLKVLALIILLTSINLSQDFMSSSVVSAASAKPTATAKPTPQPVMTDNLSKYGLKKTISFPYTMELNGLSYTIHKLMIFEVKSKEAQALIKLYKYPAFQDRYRNPKYFIWTKITINNKSKYKAGVYADSLSQKWEFIVDDMKNFEAVNPLAKAWDWNSEEALWSFILNPGEKLDSYQAFYYDGDLNYLRLVMHYKGGFKEDFLANPPEWWTNQIDNSTK